MGIVSFILNCFIYFLELYFFRDEDAEDGAGQTQKQNEQMSLGGNPYLEVPSSQNAVEYKKGYVMRKCCYESNAKRSEYKLHKITIFHIPIL